MNEAFVKEALANNPEITAKIAGVLRALEITDPEGLAETSSEIASAISGVPEKTAGELLGQFGKALAVAAGGALATDIYDIAKRGLSKSTSKNAILEQHPDLKHQDKASVDAAFNTLHRYAPEFTADPNMGGFLLKRMVELPHDQHNLVKELINARKNIRDIRKSQFSVPNIQISEESPEGRQSRSDASQKKLEEEKGKNSLGIEQYKANLQRENSDRNTKIKYQLDVFRDPNSSKEEKKLARNGLINLGFLSKKK